MVFALIVLIVVSIILVIGSFSIWKSDGSENEKIISIIAILALFAVATIINEAKNHSQTGEKINAHELEKHFYSFRDTEIEARYELPLLNDTREFITETLGEYSLENSKSAVFLLLEGEKGIGKTFAIKKYLKILQIDHTPALYIDFRHIRSDLNRLADHLTLSNISLLEPALDILNNRSHVPVIVFDHAEYAFKDNDPAAISTFCKYIKALFDSKKIKLILITNRPDVKLKLRTDVDISRRLNVREFHQRSYETISKYLIEKFNPAVVRKHPEKRFNEENTHVLFNTIGFHWNVINSYKTQGKEVLNVHDFCRVYINGLVLMLQDRLEERGIYQVLLDEMLNPETKKYINQGISYSIIKTNLNDTQFDLNVKEAVEDGILRLGHGTVAFANVAIFNAAIRLIK